MRRFNLLIAIALGWSASSRARLGMVLAGILLVRSGDAVDSLGKFVAPMPPAPLPLSLTGLGALAINLSCAFMLARFRAHSGSLTRAAFLSARNDTVANVCDHRGRVRYRLYAFGLARLVRWSRHRSDEPRRPLERSGGRHAP